MKIAIQAADLDHSRIDGTRVYIANLLKNFGKFDTDSNFVIYHKNTFNPELTPPVFPNYEIKTVPWRWPFWTQTKFAWRIWQDQPEVLWMPIQTMPAVRHQNLKTVITIHDLAFKYFPDNFLLKDRIKLNLFSNFSINRADKIIAISEATKRDILKFFPKVAAEKIKVIYHGFDAELFARERDLAEEERIKKELGVSGSYILYTGAIQPRKNLATLIAAFEILKKDGFADVELVLAGEKAWLSQSTIEKAETSPNKDQIKMLGRLKFEALGPLFRGAGVFVFPSLYEGFGLPVLEAFAAGVPVIAANNSSLPEVGGEAARYFDANDPQALAEWLRRVLSEKELRETMIAQGKEQIKKFSWEKCAQETLDFLRN